MFKLHHLCLDVLTEDQQAHAELKWKYRQSSSGNISTRSFVSLFSFSSKSLIEDWCGGSSQTPVDRAGGVKIIEAF